MMILWTFTIFLGSLCAAQNNIISQSTLSGSSLPFGGSASASSNQFNQLPRPQSSGVSVSTSAGSASASASAKVIVPQVYPICLKLNPDDGVSSSSPFAYAMLEGSFTNPFLKQFYSTSFDTSAFYDVLYDELRETLPKDKSQLLAGSFSLLSEVALPKLTPVLNAISITNAISKIFSDDSIVIVDDKEDYIEPFLTSISKALTDSDGSAKGQAQAIVSGLLDYLDYINKLSYSKLHEFSSILAGEYRLAIYSSCKPSNFETIPKP